MSFEKDFKNRVNPSPSVRHKHSHGGKWIRVPLLIGGLSVIGVVLATTKSNTNAPHSADKELSRFISQSLDIPKPEPAQATPNLAGRDTNWSEVSVQAGDSASGIFSKLNIHSHLHEILKDERTSEAFASLRPGHQFKARYNESEQLQELVYSPSKTEEIRIKPTASGYEFDHVSHDVDTRTVVAKATINNSLYLDGKKAGLSDNLVMQLFNVFAYDIDFALEIRKGDSFTVIYEERFLNGEKLKRGSIKAAEFINRGKSYKAYRYTDKNGNTDYYNEKGQSLKKAFIRSPIKSARISSHFNPNRLHPVLHKIRAHKGVDYAAPIGTPIRATGSGKVLFKGTKGGYGKTIILQHGKRYTTLYAHLNAFNKKVKKNGKVSQGQVIGYVGKTGRVTGPHLHYEFRINNVHKNPVTVKLPNGAPLKKAELPSFKEETRKLALQLNAESRLIAQK